MTQQWTGYIMQTATLHSTKKLLNRYGNKKGKIN